MSTARRSATASTAATTARRCARRRAASRHGDDTEPRRRPRWRCSGVRRRAARRVRALVHQPTATRGISAQRVAGARATPRRPDDDEVVAVLDAVRHRRRRIAGRACAVGAGATRGRDSSVRDQRLSAEGRRHPEHLWELWRRLPEGRAHILTTAYRGDAEFDASQRYPVERAGKVLLPTPATRRRIVETADRVGAGLVVLDPAHIVGLLGPSLGRPYALIVHGAELSIPARTPGYNLALRRAMRGARLIIAAGPWVAREAQKVAPDVDVVDIPPGVDGDLLPADQRRANARERPAATRRRARRRGRVPPQPARAAQRRRHAHPRRSPSSKTRGPTSSRSSRGVAVVTSNGCVVWRRSCALRSAFSAVSPTDELVATFGAADVFSHVCRNRWGGLEQEGFGIIFLEAAACGIPQIAGNSGGASDAVLDGVTGLRHRSANRCRRRRPRTRGAARRPLAARPRWARRRANGRCSTSPTTTWRRASTSRCRRRSRRESTNAPVGG